MLDVRLLSDAPLRSLRALVRGEEECSIAFDGAAEQSAEDVALEHGPLDAGRFQERVIGVEGVVAEVFVNSAVKLVRAAARDRLHAAAGAAPERRVVERGLDLELLNRLRRGHGHRLRAVTGPAGWRQCR